MAVAKAPLDSTTNFVTGLKYVYVFDRAVCSHPSYLQSLWMKHATDATNLVKMQASSALNIHY